MSDPNPSLHAAEKRGRLRANPFEIFGADHWYTVGAQRVRALRNDLAHEVFRPGYLRSVGAGWTN
jgi:hypothetical protein